MQSGHLAIKLVRFILWSVKEYGLNQLSTAVVLFFTTGFCPQNNMISFHSVTDIYIRCSAIGCHLEMYDALELVSDETLPEGTRNYVYLLVTKVN